ncbi:zinc finger MYM-type protein 1-like protein [Tanacetum coccineum]
MEESPRARVEPETNTTLNMDEVKLESLIRDPGVRPPLSSYPSNQQDEIRRTYIRLGPYQLVKAHYPLSPCGFHKRRKPIGRVGSDTIYAKGFNNWRKVNSGIACPFVNHEDIRGQGYDRASNMRGEWNGLNALILNECPFAYYVHCFAHQLQLALVAASKDVSEVHTFYKHLNFIVNVIGLSTRRNDQLQDAQLAEISYLAKIGELEGGRGANQMQNIQRPGDTRWSSHFKSICSLVRLFGPTRVVLNDICIGRSTGPQKGDAKYALTHLLSFDFILVLHLMKKIMEITYKLCKFLQNKSQDIVNALTLVSTTKTLIQKLRDDGWQSLIDQVVCFCDKYNIPVPDMNATYRDIIQSRNKKDDVTVEHHYQVDVFIVAIDSLLQELNNRFNESVSELLRELLRLSVTLDPKKSFNADDICKLVTKYHPLDFTEQERIELRLELQHFELDSDPKLKNVSSLSALCRGLQETEKSECSFIA